MVVEAEVQIPEGFPGTTPEWLVYQALTQLGYKDGEDFDYQSSEQGGRAERGGSVLDFYIISLNLCINIQGTYWHYGRVGQTANDVLIRESLESQGIRVVYLDEDDVMRNARYFVEEALKGNDYSRMVR